MHFRGISGFATVFVLAVFIQNAHAGAIRCTAKELHKGSITAVQRTSDATGTAVGSLEDAGKLTRAALKNDAGVARKDVVSAPGAAVRGTKSAAGRLWKAVW